jgi:hypothetical protein
MPVRSLHLMSCVRPDLCIKKKKKKKAPVPPQYQFGAGPGYAGPAAGHSGSVPAGGGAGHHSGGHSGTIGGSGYHTGPPPVQYSGVYGPCSPVCDGPCSPVLQAFDVAGECWQKLRWSSTYGG